MNLPFLQESKWPTAREPEERVVNPSHDLQLQDHLIEEFMRGYEKGEHSKMREALVALIHGFKNEDMGDSDDM